MSFQKSRRLAIAIVMVAIIWLISVPAKAIALSSANTISLSSSQLIASTEMERREDAAARELEGYMQKENGDEVGSPGDQVAGRVKQATGAAQTRIEDAKAEGENLVDRIKEFFESDDSND